MYCGRDLDRMRKFFFNRSRINIEICSSKLWKVAEMVKPVAHFTISPPFACALREDDVKKVNKQNSSLLSTSFSLFVLFQRLRTVNS